MENETSRRPLRGMGDKVRDLYNTYVRNEEQHEHIAKPTDYDPNNEQLMNDDTSMPTEIKIQPDTNDRTSALEKENAEMRDQILRKTAEMENMRRRFLKEKQELIEYANHHLLVKMLPVIDDLHTALEAAKKTTDYQSLLKGIEMIFQKSVKIFEDAGVLPIENAVGQPFNVDVHEALAHLPSEAPEGHIIQVVQKGYMLREKVLRHAKVITSAGMEDN